MKYLENVINIIANQSSGQDFTIKYAAIVMCNRLLLS